MKATIDQNGTMYVKPETELEVYALKKWCEEYAKLAGCEDDPLIVSLRLDDSDTTD